MSTIFERFDDAYIYGPLSEEQVADIPVNHRILLLDNGYFVGVNQEMPDWADKYIPRPQSNNE